MKDHVVQLKESEDGSVLGNKVYDDLLAYRQAISQEVIPPKLSSL